MESSLKKEGLKFETHYKFLPGCPDIVFLKQRVAVFCDSDFWHGYKWSTLRLRLRTNRHYWIPKIKRNKQRDRFVNKELRKMGWTSVRLWEHQIKNDLRGCVNSVMKYLAKPSTPRYGKN